MFSNQILRYKIVLKIVFAPSDKDGVLLFEEGGNVASASSKEIFLAKKLDNPLKILLFYRYFSLNCRFTCRIRIEDGGSLVKGCMDVLFVYMVMLEFVIISWSETKHLVIK